MEQTTTLANKHVLLDTCLLVEASKKTECFEPFFISLLKRHVSFCIDPIVQLELLRSSHTAAKLKEKIIFLYWLFGDRNHVLSLNISNDIFTDARRISNLYFHNGIKGIDLPDCILAAHLKKHPHQLLLATLNNQHFPTVLLDRRAIEVIDDSEKIHTIGFYAFSNNKYDLLSLAFSKSVDTKN